MNKLRMRFSLVTVISSLVFFTSLSVLGQEGTVKGKVLDKQNSSAMEFANIAVLTVADSSLVTGSMTGIDGSFSFKAPAGSFLIRIGFIGYESFFKTVLIPTYETLNLGTLRIAADATNLQVVVIEGVSSIFQSDVDKRTYNMENSIVAEGATASELLATLPSIQVDEAGGITMRGSGEVLIYINGRPSNLSSSDTENILSRFPVNSIKTVELITNPSSRYDAAGVGGIINIILKENSNLGFNGQLNASVGTRDKYQAGFNMNYGREKINYFLSTDLQDRQRYAKGTGLRENFIPGLSKYLKEDSYEIERRKTALLRTGFEYNISPRKTLAFYAQGNYTQETEDETINQRNENESNTLDSLYVRERLEMSKSRNIESGLNYTWNLDSIGQRLYTSYSFAYDLRDQIQTGIQSFYDAESEFVPANSLVQIDESLGESTFQILQVDYEKPFNEAMKLEAGLKGTLGKWKRTQAFSQGDQGNDFVPAAIDSLSDTYSFDEDVYAAYLIFRNKGKKFGYQAGLRAEYTARLGILQSTDAHIRNNYFDLFPSIYTTYSLGKEHELSMNYSRRISRPDIRSLSPIYSMRDQFNFSIGNPFLKPEYTDSYEFGYMKGWAKYLLNSTLYHRYSTDVQTRIITLLDNGIAIQSRENANTRKATGLEVINQVEITEWFDVALTGNFFYSQIFGDNLGEGFNNSNFSWTVNLLSTMAIPRLFNVQIQGNYRGPIVLPQGEIRPMWGINIGLRKDVLAKRGTLSLNVSDVFYTQIFRIETKDPRFDYSRVMNRETRIGTLAFTYRFGGFKEKVERSDREGGGMDIDD